MAADSERRYARGAFGGSLNLVRRLANRERYFLHARFSGSLICVVYLAGSPSVSRFVSLRPRRLNYADPRLVHFWTVNDDS